jgi:hypothetical protein
MHDPQQVCGKRRKLKKRRARIEQEVDAISRQ